MKVSIGLAAGLLVFSFSASASAKTCYEIFSRTASEDDQKPGVLCVNQSTGGAYNLTLKNGNKVVAEFKGWAMLPKPMLMPCPPNVTNCSPPIFPDTYRPQMSTDDAVGALTISIKHDKGNVNRGTCVIGKVNFRYKLKP
ncbi:MAG: hypothetical protein HYY84_03695 [Deltaproteobacteria bacterium]|nr:hypothetical protein [Deltaproteobacteria bacterium]